MKFQYQNVYSDGESHPHLTFKWAQDTRAAAERYNSRYWLGYNLVVQDPVSRRFTVVIFVPRKDE